jgi:hypothetical protein
MFYPPPSACFADNDWTPHPFSEVHYWTIGIDSLIYTKK